MPFIHDDFLLSNNQAVSLYHEYAKNEPILDFITIYRPMRSPRIGGLKTWRKPGSKPTTTNGGQCGQMAHPRN